jgi:4-alpha-glucanotransferase
MTQYIPTVHHWWDAQSKQTQQTYRQVDSDYSKTIHQEMEEDHTTKEARDQGVEKHSCQIELRGAHLNLVYYNGKQVLCAYIMVHVTVLLHVRNEDELADTYTYMLR